MAIDTSVTLKPVAATGFDLAIRHGRGLWPRCRAENLFDEELVVVCSPAYRGGDLPRTPAELASHTLLTYAGSQEWQQWAAHARCEHLLPRAATTLSDAALMLSAAIAGQGIAIGRSAIVFAHLRRGDLVALFDIRAPATYSYFLVTAEAGVHALHVRHFIEWLRAEARQTQLELEELGFRR